MQSSYSLTYGAVYDASDDIDIIYYVLYSTPYLNSSFCYGMRSVTS